MSRHLSHSAALARIRAANRPAVPWADGSKIPWHEPAFSQRMLQVHLNPDTHMASRSLPVIGRHVDWLMIQLADSGTGPARILDVGCGPGLYCHELARRSQQTVGFDFAPAPLAWAGETAESENLDCVFLEADLTDLPADFATRVGPVDAITFWFGEFNSFPPEAVVGFLPRLAGLLRPGGRLFLEYQPWDLFARDNHTSWSVENESVLCPVPHLWLQEFAWNEEARAEIHVHWILEEESGNLTRYAQCHQGWTDSELVELLESAGLVDPVFYPPITGVAEDLEFPVVVTRRLP